MMKKLYNGAVEVVTTVSLIIGMLAILYVSTTVVVTALKLEGINSDIRANQEEAAILQGHVDTTGINDQIEELMEKRKENYYRSDNILVSRFSTQSALTKVALFVVAFIVDVLFISIGVVMVRNTLMAFRQFLLRLFR